jgi:DNA-binding FrmR family transcriptional regulator
MVAEERPCAEVLDQFAAVKTALYSAGILMLENHTRECIRNAREGDGGEDALDDLVRVVRKFAR